MKRQDIADIRHGVQRVQQNPRDQKSRRRVGSLTRCAARPQGRDVVITGAQKVTEAILSSGFRDLHLSPMENRPLWSPRSK
eukprot:4430197-Amphidinium_carterae.1